MNIHLSRDAALAAVSRAAAICARTNTIPILGHVVIDASDGRAMFRASNLEAEVASTAPADVDRPGSAALPAHCLADALKSLPAGSHVRICVDDLLKPAEVTCGRSRFSLPTLAPDLLPTFSLGARKVEVDAPAAALQAVSLVAHAAGREDTKSNLIAVCIRGEGGDLKAYATNRHRAAAASVPVGGAHDWHCMVHPRAAEQAADFATGAENVSLRVSESLFEVEADGVRFTSKLMDAEPLPYERAFGADLPYTAKVDRADLIQAIKRALIVNRDKERSIRLDFAADFIRVSATGEGAADDEIAATFDGPETYALVNAGYMLDALNRCDGPSVNIRAKDQKYALIITDPEAPGVRFLVGVQHG